MHDSASTQVFKAAAQEAASIDAPLLASPTLPTTVLQAEQPQPQVPLNAYYAQLQRACMGALLAATLLAATTYTATQACLRFTGGSYWGLAVAWMALVEVPFYYWFKRHAAQFDTQPQPHAPDRLDPQLHFRRLVQHAM